MVDPPNLHSVTLWHSRTAPLVIEDNDAIRHSTCPTPQPEHDDIDAPFHCHPHCRSSDLSAAPTRQARPTNTAVRDRRLYTHKAQPSHPLSLFGAPKFSSLVVALLLTLALFATLSHGHVVPSDGGTAFHARAEPRMYERSQWADNEPQVADWAALNRRADASLSQRSTHTTSYAPRQPYIAQSDQIGHGKRADPPLARRQAAPESENTCSCESVVPEGRKIGFGILVPILVLLSGVFAGLTLGYMSLDETQLHVLMTTGTEIQRERARKIIPIREDGHLLLTTLLIANMITNETLPIIFDPLLSSSGAGGASSVVLSTVLIVIFSELIPQSTCSRYGLQIGAVMAVPTRIIIIILYPIAWPVSRILHWVLGAHHGIVYRRAELKELVTMHAASGGRGGDLKRDTVMIVGGALDLQEKVVREAMTPIDQVFMLPFTAKLDYPTLERVVRSGHSRIPIYQEVEVPMHKPRSGAATPKRKMGLFTSLSRKTTAEGKDSAPAASDSKAESPGPDVDGMKILTRKKIVGTLLVKSCVLLDPEDAVPVSSMVINALPSVPGDEPLLNVLNAFQEGRSHMAIVSSRSRRDMASESVADLGSKSNLYRSSQGPPIPPAASAAPRVDGLGDIDEEKNIEGAETRGHRHSRSSSGPTDSTGSTTRENGLPRKHGWRAKLAIFSSDDKHTLEQAVPSDATIAESVAQDKASDREQLIKIDSRISIPQGNDDGITLPIGIITLEDVLEELLCEEILDEYDDRGNEEQDFRTLIPPPSPDHVFKSDTDEKGVGADGGDYESNSKTCDEDVMGAQTGVTNSTNAPLSGMSALPQSAKKAVMKRFGLGGRQKSVREEDSSSSPTTDSGGRAPAPSGEGTLQRPGKPEPISLPPSAISAVDKSKPHENSTDSIRRSMRSSSNPPSNDKPDDAGSPSLNVGADDRPAWSALPGAISSPPLLTPTTGRPLVVRTKDADGAEKTTIATESMLRGRPVAPSSGGGGVGGAGTSASPALGGASLTQPMSRSQTPIGTNRGLRFKSQAVSGAGTGSGFGTGLTQRSRSQGGEAPASRLQRGNSFNASVLGSAPVITSPEQTRSSSPEPIQKEANPQESAVSGSNPAAAHESDAENSRFPNPASQP